MDQGFGAGFDAHVLAGYRFLMRYYESVRTHALTARMMVLIHPRATKSTCLDSAVVLSRPSSSLA